MGDLIPLMGFKLPESMLKLFKEDQDGIQLKISGKDKNYNGNFEVMGESLSVRFRPEKAQNDFIYHQVSQKPDGIDFDDYSLKEGALWNNDGLLKGSLSISKATSDRADSILKRLEQAKKKKATTAKKIKNPKNQYDFEYRKSPQKVNKRSDSSDEMDCDLLELAENLVSNIEEEPKKSLKKTTEVSDKLHIASPKPYTVKQKLPSKGSLLNNNPNKINMDMFSKASPNKTLLRPFIQGSLWTIKLDEFSISIVHCLGSGPKTLIELMSLTKLNRNLIIALLPKLSDKNGELYSLKPEIIKDLDPSKYSIRVSKPDKNSSRLSKNLQKSSSSTQYSSNSSNEPISTTKKTESDITANLNNPNLKEKSNPAIISSETKVTADLNSDNQLNASLNTSSSLEIISTPKIIQPSISSLEKSPSLPNKNVANHNRSTLIKSPIHIHSNNEKDKLTSPKKLTLNEKISIAKVQNSNLNNDYHETNNPRNLSLNEKLLIAKNKTPNKPILNSNITSPNTLSLNQKINTPKSQIYKPPPLPTQIANPTKFPSSDKLNTPNGQPQKLLFQNGQSPSLLTPSLNAHKTPDKRDEGASNKRNTDNTTSEPDTVKKQRNYSSPNPNGRKLDFTSPKKNHTIHYGLEVKNELEIEDATIAKGTTPQRADILDDKKLNSYSIIEESAKGDNNQNIQLNKDQKAQYYNKSPSPIKNGVMNGHNKKYLFSTSKNNEKYRKNDLSPYTEGYSESSSQSRPYIFKNNGYHNEYLGKPNYSNGHGAKGSKFNNKPKYNNKSISKRPCGSDFEEGEELEDEDTLNTSNLAGAPNTNSEIEGSKLENITDRNVDSPTSIDSSHSLVINDLKSNDPNSQGVGVESFKSAKDVYSNRLNKPEKASSNPIENKPTLKGSDTFSKCEKSDLDLPDKKIVQVQNLSPENKPFNTNHTFELKDNCESRSSNAIEPLFNINNAKISKYAIENTQNDTIKPGNEVTNCDTNCVEKTEQLTPNIVPKSGRMLDFHNSPIVQGSLIKGSPANNEKNLDLNEYFEIYEYVINPLQPYGKPEVFFSLFEKYIKDPICVDALCSDPSFNKYKIIDSSNDINDFINSNFKERRLYSENLYREYEDLHNKLNKQYSLKRDQAIQLLSKLREAYLEFDKLIISPIPESDKINIKCQPNLEKDEQISLSRYARNPFEGSILSNSNLIDSEIILSEINLRANSTKSIVPLEFNFGIGSQDSESNSYIMKGLDGNFYIFKISKDQDKHFFLREKSSHIEGFTECDNKNPRKLDFEDLQQNKILEKKIFDVNICDEFITSIDTLCMKKNVVIFTDPLKEAEDMLKKHSSFRKLLPSEIEIWKILEQMINFIRAESCESNKLDTKKYFELYSRLKMISSILNQ
ncbi:hypothetical protein AYI70_g5336 [Smittium culicis]|uniref:Uncharacterized protein n=1 Tax=Smittium culicis TaxID=133412 RepID=A0A1R1XGH0_9FUNG|nr:hypothetical protein AYI70_g8335 [Smittium culicis]OMJ18481.1 hypothetical protein AYI70_g5336 [Smittium culicis]